MGFEITAYTSLRMSAVEKSHGTSNWVVITVHEPARWPAEGETECTLTVHFDGAHAWQKAKGYADAINSVPVYQDAEHQSVGEDA